MKPITCFQKLKSNNVELDIFLYAKSFYKFRYYLNQKTVMFSMSECNSISSPSHIILSSRVTGLFPVVTGQDELVPQWI